LSVHIGGPSSNQESRKRPSNPSDSKESRSLRTDTKGRAKVRIRGAAGSAEFMAAYHAALSGIDSEEQRRQYQRAAKGSFRYVCLAYYDSPEFKWLDPKTQYWRRRALDRICERHGNKPIDLIQPKHVRNLRDELATRRSRANERLKALKALFRWAMESDLAANDPTRDVRAIQYASEGHPAWTLDDVKSFEQTHPIGTKPRLAMALLLYTAGRREDVVRLGPQHIHDDRLRYTQAKNEHRKPVRLNIPVHSELAKIIADTPSGHLTFLVSDFGKPFSPTRFSIKFRMWCDQAGLHHLSAHGLRKLAAARLAECGATPHEIMAITGHQSLEQVQHYAQSARQSELADSAMSKLKK
jgi:integrase/recombinase XerD